MHILPRGALMAAVLCALPFGTANAQLRAPIHSQSPAPTQAPAPPPAPAPAPPPTSAPVKLTVPIGLFKLPPAQILTVGGKQTTAGAIHKEINAQILKQAGAPTLVKVASAKKPSHPALVAPTPPPTGSNAMVVNHDCTGRAPVIQTVTGSVTPGGVFTISGTCFGDETGIAKLIGPFPGGTLALTFSHWSAGKIIASVPAVRGASDQSVALSVITSAKSESASKPVSFVATREKVEVPSRMWTPAHYAVTRETTESKPTKEETSPTSFSVTVNPLCVLDSMEAIASVGAVVSVTGWSDGPPNASTVQVAWSPQVTITTYNYGVFKDSYVYSSIAIDMKAWADCPLGIAP